MNLDDLGDKGQAARVKHLQSINLSFVDGFFNVVLVVRDPGRKQHWMFQDPERNNSRSLLLLLVAGVGVGQGLPPRQLRGPLTTLPVGFPRHNPCRTESGTYRFLLLLPRPIQ